MEGLEKGSDKVPHITGVSEAQQHDLRKGSKRVCWTQKLTLTNSWKRGKLENVPLHVKKRM